MFYYFVLTVFFNPAQVYNRPWIVWLFYTFQFFLKKKNVFFLNKKIVFVYKIYFDFHNVEINLSLTFSFKEF